MNSNNEVLQDQGQDSFHCPAFEFEYVLLQPSKVFKPLEGLK